ncbi:MAG: alanine racemase [Alphaproteobacteria bacterium]|nr:alanine racemase [Alphaproteobacteria bacterium]
MQTSPYALINLSRIAANYCFLCDNASPTEVGAAVKANAYGLGMEEVAQTLFDAGCRTFFTAHFEEALALREIIHYAVITPLHGVDPGSFEEAAEKNITPMLNHLTAIKAWASFAREKEMHLPAMIHLDTGMNRLGLPSSEQGALAQNPELLDGIEILAWVSHLACADDVTSPMTPEQLARMKEALVRLPKAPVSLCNSSGIFWGADYLFDLARPGIALYGGNPTPHLPNPMQGVIELCSPILQVHEATTESTVGYGATHRFTRPSRVAVIALGYADGYHRTLHNKGTVMIGTHPAPVVGRISMDLITIDVTDVPENALALGAPVTLIGPHRPIDVAAQEAGTIPYELLTAIGNRVQRVYREDEGVA